MSVKLKSLAVRGFRAYGKTEQVLGLPSDVAVVWGPNSKGKTSLGEAFEFLLTGRISRRELMASSQDEFAGALRNVHLTEDEEVYVAATLIASDGKEHEIKRSLISDYAKRQDCSSRLELDGAQAEEADILALGIVLSQPPLRAPVLAQHTISHIFSAKPADRTTYFKALFEVSDLDELRNEIASLIDDLAPPDDPILAKFDRCAVHEPIMFHLMGIDLGGMPDEDGLAVILDECVTVLLNQAEYTVPATATERRIALETALADARSKTFPVRGFDRTDLLGWSAPTPAVWAQLQKYIEEKSKVDEKTRQLSALFVETLKLPDLGENDVDCPLCATEGALTPARVKLISQHVQDTEGFQKAESDAKVLMAELLASARNLSEAATASKPSFLKAAPGARRKKDFTVRRLREILGDEADTVVSRWLTNVRTVVRSSAALRCCANAVRTSLQKTGSADQGYEFDTAALTTAFGSLALHHAAYATVLAQFDAVTVELRDALNIALDAQSDTACWQDLLDLIANIPGVLPLLTERTARSTVSKELDQALNQIDTAKVKVLEEKFSDYSGAIQGWWELLRPDESTFFSAVQPRKGAKRTIDFKAGLSATSDKSAAKLRDVIAIFSQSQLHCLGLALFLARAEREAVGFVVLDDPVLSSDEDYRVHFNSAVLSKLHSLSIQVIVLTQDHSTWEELEMRYRHLGISTAQLYIDTPADGTIIQNTSDALVAKITRASSLARGGHPDLQKECGIQLRDAGERFCKEILVRDCAQSGGTMASLSDYDGKTMEWLFPRIEKHLNRDPSHPGKFSAFKKIVNNACHDNAPPTSAAMVQATGEIRFLTKQYLGR